MPDVPRFSVTIPAYNAESTLAETVASVEAQTFADWECVIVDDGSTDGTRALAESLAAGEPRIRVVSQENRGSGGAYNTAVRSARSDLLVMLSADDVLFPHHLASFDAFIGANPEASVFTCDGWFEYEDGTREPQDLNARWAGAISCRLVDLLQACFYGIGAVYRRDVFDTVGGFKEDMYAEDYVFWLLALANRFEHRYLDARLSVHRRNWVQKSADSLRVREADIRAIQVVIDTGLLTPEEKAAAEESIARLKRNIRIRRALQAVLGRDMSTRLINRVRHRRIPPAGSGASR